MNFNSKLSTACALSGLLLLGFPANAQSISLGKGVTSELVFEGACDGSAAVKIGAGGLLVANDETNVLASYDVHSGTPIAKKDLNELLGFFANEDGEIWEIDIEAAAIHENQIWWIGSHGRNNNGEERLIRRSLFATNVPRADLSDLEITSARIDMLSILIGSEMTARFFLPEVLTRKPKEGGVNIEAMTFDPAGNLILGFRAPLNGEKGVFGDALLVRLSPTQVGFQVSQVQELNLNGRGFRDIVAIDGMFLIIAGLISNGGRSSIYSWDGENSPIEIKVDGMNGFNPEALVVMDQQLFVISDDGRVMRQDDEQGGEMRRCKKILGKNGQGNENPSVFFRARTFSFE